MAKQKRSLFQKLTGIVHMDDDTSFDYDNQNLKEAEIFPTVDTPEEETEREDWLEKESEEGELTVDVYQTATDIIIKAMVAGVRGEELDIAITRELVTIKGSRAKERTVNDEDYFHQELYWGSFTRTIVLPHEVIPEEAEATEKHGLLTIKIPKIDRDRKTKVRVKSGV